MKYCYQCGCTLPENADRCPVCGEPIAGSVSETYNISVDELSFGFRLLCFFVPVFGFIWALFRLRKNSFQAKRAASTAYGGALLQIAVGFFVLAVAVRYEKKRTVMQAVRFFADIRLFTNSG